MRPFLLALYLAGAAALCCTPARAAVTLEKLELSDTARVLIVKGSFELSDDPAELISTVSMFRPTFISFNSGGGNVSAAIKFGRAIRSLGLTTFQLRSSECASACTLAFMGGEQRIAEPGSIGVHQSSFSEDLGLDSRSAVAAVQAVTAQIITYMVEMGVDPQLLELSLSVESADMRYLTSSEMKRFRVTTQLGGEPVASLTPAKPSVVAEEPIAEEEPETLTADTSAEAVEFLDRYFAAWSGPNDSALAFMRTAYEDEVHYYGKPVSLGTVLKEKQAFAKRWPQRAYCLREGSAKAQCEDLCMISAVVEWYAHSEPRQKTASGAATISLEWNPFSGRIMLEMSEVIKGDKGASAPTRLISQWQEENETCRGGSGDQPATLRACDRREALGSKLSRLDWCFGREGESGYQHEWHRCGPTSQR